MIQITQPRKSYRCAHCGSKNVFSQGKIERRFKTVPIGSTPVEIQLDVPRVRCRDCGLVRQVKIPFANGKRRYTKVFEQYVLKLISITTTKNVATHLHVGWDLIRDIEKRYLHKKFRHPKLKHVQRIAIDEIAVRKGHSYLTIVLDLDRGNVLFVGNGRKAAALTPFWKRLKRAKAQVVAVAIDMSPAYIKAVTENLPQAQLVFDRFHLVKLFNDKLSTLRRQLYHEAVGPLEKKVLKGTRWLLLKNTENLDADKNEHARLQEALSLNRPLSMAYYLKDELKELWRQPSKQAADRLLTSWSARARSSGIRILQKFANLLEGYRSGILAWYDHRISTARLEGLNNKIKTLKRSAYGYRNLEYFKLKILAIHQCEYALTG